ncbi:MAG: glutathione S-transferase family protein [Bacillota bacterium]
MLKLYYSPRACSLAVHILLEEVNAPYELELVSIAKGKTRSPEYLAINPKGRVPVLRTEEGEILTELPAISWYVAQLSTSPALFPHGRLAATRCFEWFNWLSGTVHAMAFGQYWRPQRFVAEEELFPRVKQKGRANILENFAMIEQRLTGRGWSVGNAYTVVDPYLLVFFAWGGRIGLSMRDSYPHWAAHAERVEARPAVQKVLREEGVELWAKAA